MSVWLSSVCIGGISLGPWLREVLGALVLIGIDEWLMNFEIAQMILARVILADVGA